MPDLSKDAFLRPMLVALIFPSSIGRSEWLVFLCRSLFLRPMHSKTSDTSTATGWKPSAVLAFEYISESCSASVLSPARLKTGWELDTFLFQRAGLTDFDERGLIRLSSISRYSLKNTPPIIREFVSDKASSIGMAQRVLKRTISSTW